MMFRKFFKLHSPTAHAILKTFKTSLVPINHELHEKFMRFPILIIMLIRNVKQGLV